jgi:hypothetical protein
MKKVPNAARDLNAARLYVNRLWGGYTFNSKSFEDVEYFTVMSLGTKHIHVEVVFYTQPSLQQYLEIARIESKFHSRYVVVGNITQLTCWKE